MTAPDPTNVEQMRALIEEAMMAYSETQPDEETRMARMIAPISELSELINCRNPTHAPDQTNAEVSDERLRELSEPPFAWVRHGKSKWFWRYSPPTSQSGDGWFPLYRSHEAALNRRSVTSEGAVVPVAWKVEASGLPVATLQPDAYSILEVSKPKSGGAPFVLTIHACNEETGRWDDISIALTRQLSDDLSYLLAPASPSKRVERLETAEAALIWAMDEIDVLSNKLCQFGYPQGMSMLDRREQLDNYRKAVDARRQALHGDRS